MNYEKIYSSIIEKALLQNRAKSSGTYYELHHILPKCLGGSNAKSNTVLLTAREHYVAHKCLYLKSTEIDEKFKMLCALKRFMYSKNSNGYKIKSRDYEHVRISHAKFISDRFKGIRKTDQHSDNISAGLKIYYENNSSPFLGKTHDSDTRKKMSISQSGEKNPQFGKSRTEKEKSKISKSMKGKKKSSETIEKFKQRRNSEEQKRQISEGLKKYHAERKKLREMAETLS